MKRIVTAVLLIIGLGFAPLSYGVTKHIPEGSRLISVYYGRFSGEMTLVNGIIHIELYQTPEGKKLFTGVLEQEDTGDSVLFRGELKGSTLKGTFDAPVHGTFSGQISDNARQLSGTFESLELRDGTWKARKEH